MPPRSQTRLPQFSPDAPTDLDVHSGAQFFKLW